MRSKLGFEGSGRRVVEVGWPSLPTELVEELRGRGLVDYLKDPSIGKKRLVKRSRKFTSTLRIPSIQFVDR